MSLYGERSKPRAEDLRGLDALVVDLQDAGRPLLHLREHDAAVPRGRGRRRASRSSCSTGPNPLGGERVEGPERDPAMPFSMVSTAPGPLVHGLTLGEMARLANARRAKPGRVSVVAMARLDARHDVGRHAAGPG